MAEKPKKKAPTAGTRRRRKPAGQSTGLAATELQAAAPQGEVVELHRAIEQDGGKVLSVYREPYGGHWLVLAALPLPLPAAVGVTAGLVDAPVWILVAALVAAGTFGLSWNGLSFTAAAEAASLRPLPASRWLSSAN